MQHRSFVRAAATGAALALLLGSLGAPVALAAGPIAVTTTADSLAADGACSLREAIRAANLDVRVDACRAGSGADRIRLPAGTYTFAIAGVDEDAASTGDLDITANLTITGAGRDLTILDAAALDRVFDILAPASVTMTDLTITGGALLDFTQSRLSGGGISNAGSLDLIGIAVNGNQTFGEGGGIFSAGRLVAHRSVISNNATLGGSAGSGGIQASGDTWLDQVEIFGNIAGGVGGARPGRGDPGDAGGLDVSGYLLLTRSVVSGNSSAGAEWTVGGVAMARGRIVDSTIRGNSATSCGSGGIAMVNTVMVSSTVTGNRGGDCADAGGVVAFDSTIVNSTISGNAGGFSVARTVGGILASGVTILNSTITENVNSTDPAWVSDGAAGLLAEADVPTILAGVILARNVGGIGNWPDCAGPVGSNGNNLIGNTTGCTFAATPSDLVGVDPLLAPLADNGGPTLTHALLAGSPAIDAFSCAHRDAGACVVRTDQRGVPRPREGNGDHRRLYDIGSVEVWRP